MPDDDRQQKSQLPPLPENVGRRRVLTDIGGVKRHFRVVDEVVQVQANLPEKAIYLQKIEFEDEGRSEFRLAYYIIGKKPRMKGGLPCQTIRTL